MNDQPKRKPMFVPTPEGIRRVDRFWEDLLSRRYGYRVRVARTDADIAAHIARIKRELDPGGTDTSPGTINPCTHPAMIGTP